MYSNSREIDLVTDQACFDTLLAKNICKCRVGDKARLPQSGRILQICHSQGTVKVDEVDIQEDSIQIDGVLEAGILYLTAEDSAPLQAAVEQIPFHCEAQVAGAGKDSVYQLNPELEQLSCVMLGADMVEIKAVLALDLLVLQPVSQPVITGASVRPMDLEKLEQIPGIVGYIVQPGDTLWNIAKKFHTTTDHIAEANELTDDQVKSGMRLLLVKEIDRE